jgi:protein gp37
MTKTKIAWTDETANWIVGCTKISAKGAKESGCDSCYAATSANSARLQQFPQYKNVVDHKGNWNGNVEFVPKVLNGLLKGKKQRRVFSPSMSDPFHPAVKDEWVDQFMATVALTPHITYQVLTKRPERMYQYFTETWQATLEQEFLGVHIPAGFPTGRQDEVHLACEEIIDRHNLADTGKDSLWTKDGSLRIMQWDWPLPNLHLGVTVENQAAADERIPWLLKTPAAKRFLSVEPLLEGIFLGRQSLKHIDWVIVGGESGTKARQFELNWAISIRQECLDLSIPYFFKQAGSNPTYKMRPLKLKSRAGTDISEWPEDLQVQEFI